MVQIKQLDLVVKKSFAELTFIRSRGKFASVDAK